MPAWLRRQSTSLVRTRCGFDSRRWLPVVYGAPMEKFGHTWQRWDDGWSTSVDRFFVGVWPFGDGWQSKVYVEDPDNIDPTSGKAKEVGVYLGCCPSMDEAMRRAHTWVDAYEPQSVESVLAKMFADYPSLFRTLADVYNHLFFVVGNGYDWLDGALVEMVQDPAERSVAVDPMLVYENWPHDAQQRVQQILRGEKDLPKGPVPDDGAPRPFYPLSDYSLITHVPDNVRPDWLDAAYEAAWTYHARASPYNRDDTYEQRERVEQDRRRAKGITVELRRRFPGVEARRVGKRQKAETIPDATPGAR